MRIYQLPNEGERAGWPTRIAVVGSCRVLDPLEDLVRSEEALSIAYTPGHTHTMGEAVQIIAWLQGRHALDPAFAPFLFEQPALPDREAFRSAALRSADALLVEVSDLRQVVCEDHCFQSVYFYRNFASRYGTAVLPWYRNLSTGQAPTEALVATTLAQLGPLEPEERDMVSRVLRGARMVTGDAETLAEGIGELTRDWPVPVGLVSHFLVPEVRGAGMEDRRKLIMAVGAAAALRGVPVLNPSAIVSRVGRQAALANAGKDIHHFAPGLRPAVAGALLVLAGTAAKGDGGSEPAPSAPEAAPKQVLRASEVAQRLNAALGTFYEQRSAELGVEESGLYAHYKALLDRRLILGPREVATASLVTRYLGAYAEYHVRRAGLGELPLLLAALGRSAVAFEPNLPRRRGMQAFYDTALQVAEWPRERFSIGGATDVPDGEVPLNALCIATLVHAVAPPEAEPGLLAALVRYRALLLNPRNLFCRRETAGEQEAFVTAAAELGGYTTVRSFPHLEAVFLERAA